jgi:carboxylesterase type B
MPQSPGFVSIASTYTQENSTQTFLKLANATSIAHARRMSSDVLIRANSLQVGASLWGTWTFGPVADGSAFAPGLPAKGFMTGDYAANISVLNSHCGNEGPLFTPPYLKTEADVEAWFAATYPLAAPAVRAYVLDELYPPVYDGSQPYKSLLERIYLLIAESALICNTKYMNAAYEHSYAYTFDIGPSFHGCDSGYNFYDAQAANAPTGTFATYAQQLQDYQVNFITNGDPNGQGLPAWPVQGRNANAGAKLLNEQGWSTVKDPTSNPRCVWWQKALMY